MPIINKTKRTAAIYNRGREVVKVYDHGNLAWQKSTSIPDYLCFTALEAGQFTLTIPAAVTATYLSYVEWSKDGRTWNHTDNTSEAVTIDVQVASGEKVYWRGEGIKYGTYAQPSTTANSVFSSTAKFDASGNIMSLLFGENFVGVTALSSSSTYAFAGLFANNRKLKSIEELSMPATTLANVCYASTFNGCSSLTGMMRELPATDLAQSCYYMMFRICSSITSTPSITINSTNGGYQMMYAFERCTSLTDASNIIINVAGESSYASSFSGDTSLTSTPILAVERLVKGCFNIMFQNCSSLSYVKCLATDISATNCLQNWLYGVSSTGTFIQAEGVEWPRGASGIPGNWTIETQTP
jgi:hypothetical protein